MSKDRLMLGTDHGMREFLMKCVTITSCSVTVRLGGCDALNFPATRPVEHADAAKAALRPIVETAYAEGVRDGVAKVLDMMSEHIGALDREVQELCESKRDIQDALDATNSRVDVKIRELHSARDEMERVRIALGVFE